MKTPTHPERTKTPSAPAAKVSIRIGKRTTFDASVTTVGLLSVGALVSSILLSSAVIVAAAGRLRVASSGSKARQAPVKPLGWNADTTN